jgi:cell volume regulation protein A
MEISPDNIILVAGILIFVSIIMSRASARFGIPTLLIFLVVGMLFGSDGLGVHFYSAQVAQFIGMVALSIILFSGGMDTKFKEIKPVLVQGIVLSTFGVLLTAVLTGFFIFWISGYEFANIYFPLATALLLASTMSSTDSASVFSILKTQKIRLKHNLRPTLELESGSNDPMAYMLTIALIQFILSSNLGVGVVVGSFFIQFIVGGAIGFAIGKFAVKLINKVQIPYPSLYPLLLLSIILFTFALTDILKGNGYLAVYIAGIIVGNNKIVFKKEISSFLDGLTMLAQLIMFLSLGLLVNPSEMIYVLPIGLLISIFMILIARPVSVFLCLLPFRKVKFRSRLFISWVGLRGAVPIIFATYPVVANVPHSNHIFNIVFIVTLVSLIVQGMTITKVAQLLKLDLPVKDKQSDFGVEIPEELNVHLRELKLTKVMLRHGNNLKDMTLPERTLVIMVKRDGNFLIPNGQLELIEHDVLLIISEDEQERLIDQYNHPIDSDN